MGSQYQAVRRREGRYFGARVNCESVPCLPAEAIAWVLNDPRKLPYLMVWQDPDTGKIREAARVARYSEPPNQFNLDWTGWVEIRRLDRRPTRFGTIQRPMPRNGGTALLVRQLRAPVFLTTGKQSELEAIAGMIDEGDASLTARREAKEEAGLELGDLERVTDAWSSPGMSTERVALFLARYRAADRVSAGGGLAEEHEEIEVVEMPLSALAVLADRGELTDMKTLALVQTLRLRRPFLFAEKTPR